MYKRQLLVTFLPLPLFSFPAFIAFISVSTLSPDALLYLRVAFLVAIGFPPFNSCLLYTSIDLNRSAHWVFRITPDAVITRYGINYGNKITQTDVNFAISVGLEYKFKKKR